MKILGIKTQPVNKQLKYLQILEILQPSLKLTETENRYLAFFLQEKENLDKVPEPHRSELLFSDKVRKKSKEVLEIKTSQANVLFASLKKKGIIKQTDNGYQLAGIFNAIDKDTTEIVYKLSFT